MGGQRLPAHVRRLLPPEHREPRKRPAPRDTGERDFLRQHDADSMLEVILKNRLEQAGLPLGEPQYRFVPGRQYRWDRAYPERMLAIEVQGGTWSQNGHARPSMVQRDCLKLSLGAALGWRVLPLTREMIEDGSAVQLIARALGVIPK